MEIGLIEISPPPPSALPMGEGITWTHLNFTQWDSHRHSYLKSLDLICISPHQPWLELEQLIFHCTGKVPLVLLLCDVPHSEIMNFLYPEGIKRIQLPWTSEKVTWLVDYAMRYRTQMISEKSHILLLDDDEDQLMIMSHYLSGSFRVTAIKNPKEALRIIRNQHFDLLISDFQMPDCSGYEILEQTQKLSPSLPVIIMSSVFDKDKALNLVESGCAALWEKQSDLGGIYRMAAGILSRKQKTARTQTIMQVLRKSNEELSRLQILMDQSQSIIIVAEALTGQISYLNPYACFTLNIREENPEWNLTDILSLSIPWSKQTWAEIYPQIQAKGYEFFRGSLKKPHGTKDFPVQLIQSSRHIGDREYLLILGRDISEILRKEEEFKLQEERISIMTHMMDHSSEIFFLLDAKRFVFYSVNQSLENLSGYSRNELLDRSPAIIDQQMSISGCDTFFKQLNNHFKACSTPYKTVRTLLSKNSGKIPVEYTIMQKTIGKHRFWFFVGHDIRDRLQEEQTRKDMQERLFQASKMASLGNLINGVAHEINNPNNFIMMNSSIVLETWQEMQQTLDVLFNGANSPRLLAGRPYKELREDIPQLLADIHEGSQRIKTIVSNFRNLARSQTPGALKNANLKEAIDRILLLLQPTLQQQQIKVNLFIDLATPTIKMFPQELDQVLLMLLQNAIEAGLGPKNKIIITACLDSNKSVLLDIVDKGCGIRENDLPFIWDPLYTTKRDTGHVGLGLSYARNIIVNASGSIDVYSKLKEGTTFTLRLPALLT
jgi:PAS domain S-box-containing protein